MVSFLSLGRPVVPSGHFLVQGSLIKQQTPKRVPLLEYCCWATWNSNLYTLNPATLTLEPQNLQTPNIPTLNPKP